MRNDQPAKNLSEGEKTAISFAYFITRLEDKNTKPNLRETIVYIDDPVCSLDANHIYNVYSFIKAKLGSNRCKQLFISTHNIEFMNLIKDFISEELGIKNNSEAKMREAPFYMIENNMTAALTKASIIALPIQLKKFRSEYIYLFSIIYGFNQNPKADFNFLYILPNIIRRFLEAYLGFRSPIAMSWHKKLELLIPDLQEANLISKFVDTFSHNQGSERIINFPEINECKSVAKILIDNLNRMDNVHYLGLCSNCEP